MERTSTYVGIDDLAVYLPQLYLPIETLAAERGIPFAKLSKGLGLEQMAVADAREDTATMAANAVLDLMHRNDLDPATIGRIYMGTESALDGSKPTATCVLEMLEDHFADAYGPGCFLNCDVVDLTFACIGAVDALQNTLDWVLGSPDDRVGIVVASDEAKYEMDSTGEYTQGAGAVAMLVKRDPRLLRINPDFGVATRPAYDFFKPRRTVSKEEIIREVIEQLPGVSNADVDVKALADQLTDGLKVDGVLDCNDCRLTLYKQTPVFDGPYSNEAYQARIREALMNFRHRHGSKEGKLTDDFARLVFHLPYAFQARRMFSEIFVEELKARDEWEEFISRNDLEVPCADDYEDREAYLTKCGDFLKAVTKTQDYRDFVAQYIAPGEWASSRVGNLYAGSVFLALAATLEQGTTLQDLSAGQQLCVFAYGSGSKSKVFSVELAPDFAGVAGSFDIARRLDSRQKLDYATYEKLHRGLLTDNVADREGGTFYLADVHDERDETEGVRHYRYASAALV